MTKLLYVFQTMLAVTVAAILCSQVALKSDGANILALPLTNGYSHYIVIQPLLRELAERGHNVTVVSRFPGPSKPPNYNHIYLGDKFPPLKSAFTLDTVLGWGRDPFSNMVEIWRGGLKICDPVLRSGVLKDLYNSSAQFDLVITQIFAYECYSVFAHKFNTPIVSVVTSSALPWSNDRVGNPDHPAYVVNNYVDADEDMTLRQRTVNALAWIWSTALVELLSYTPSDDLVRRFLDPEAPPAQEIMTKRTALVLVNSHFSILQARPLVPNFVDIGGIHIQDPNPLPQDLKQFLDDAKNGAVVFSLGSLVRASSMSNDTLRALLDAFASLPQRVVFKYEEEIYDAPPNVLVRKWLPQRDILEHPEVRALMTHGGQSSTIEAVYAGVPLVGMPLFSDQYSNINTLVRKGAATLLDMRHLTKEKVLQALNPVLQDPSYKMNANRLSRQFRDRPMSPLQTAVYWTEYILRHQGAPQLRCKSSSLPWYRFFLLDVVAVIFICLTAVFLVCKTTYKCLMYLVILVYKSGTKYKKE